MAKETVIDVWFREEADHTRLLSYKPIDSAGYTKTTLTIPAPEKKMIKKTYWQAVFECGGELFLDATLYETKEEAIKHGVTGSKGAREVTVELFAEGE